MAVTFVPLLVEQARHLVVAGPDLLEKLQAHRTVQWADQRFNLIARAQTELRQQAPAMAGPILGVVSGLLTALAATATVVALTVFMLLFGEQVVKSGLEWVEDPAQRERYLMLARRMHTKVGGYVAGTLLVGVIAGTLTAVGTAILGVPYFLPLGLIMVVLSVIPFVGSALGALMVVGTTAATVGVRQGLFVLGGYLIYQQLENHVLQPVVQRRTISMNPLLITIVMLFGTALAGVLGTLLALPLAGAIQVVLQDVLARRKARHGQVPVQLTFAHVVPPTQQPPPEERPVH
jgi:predicted PurR-regulated permease PerM